MTSRDTFPLAFGVAVSIVLSGTLVIAGLKAGITPGVSPLVILVAWGAFAARLRAGAGSRFLNIAQVAGSAGMAVTAGVIFTAPLVQILQTDRGAAALRERGIEVPVGADGTFAYDRELLDTLAAHGEPVSPVDVPTLILLSLAGALIGFGFVGLGTRKFLTDPTLPAPEARACETMIDAAVAEAEARPRLGRSLFAGLVASFLAPLLARLGAATEHVVLWKREIGTGDDRRTFQLDLPFTPIYIGIGGLLTLATALLVFGGSFLRLIGDLWLAQIDPAVAVDAARDFPVNSMRWVGGAAMTVAVAYSLIKFAGVRAGASAPDAHDPALLEIDPARRRTLVASIAAGAALLVGWIIVADGLGAFSLAMGATVLVMCALMVTLGALLSLQIGSSASPVSGTIFVTTLVLCLVALSLGRTDEHDVLLLTPLVVGACVAVCAANDSSQDYKTLQLCGVRVQDGFLAQILGLVGGCIVVPIVVYVAHEAYVLGSADLTAPQGKMFATLVQGLLLENELPWWPIGIGLAIGALAVAGEVLARKRGLELPSMALAVGIYLPPYLGVGILVGAGARWIAERGRRQSHESILAAAGLITGAAALELILGILILGGFRLETLQMIEDAGTPVLNGVALAGIAVLAGLLFWNSRERRD